MGDMSGAVKIKRDDLPLGYGVINRSDFDPQKHVLYRERLKVDAPAKPAPVAIPDVDECEVKHMGAGRYAVLHGGKELPYARSLDRAAAKHFEDLTPAEKRAYLLKMLQDPGT